MHFSALIWYLCWYILVSDLCKILYLQKFDFWMNEARDWSVKGLKCQTRIFHLPFATMSIVQHRCLLLLLQYLLQSNCVMSFHQVLQRLFTRYYISFDSYYCVHKVRQELTTKPHLGVMLSIKRPTRNQFTSRNLVPRVFSRISQWRQRNDWCY